MPVNVKKKKDVTHLHIDDEMTIYSASTLKDELLNQLESSKDLEVSLQDVSEMDSAGLQIMLVMRDQAQKAGKNLRFVHHSAAVIDVIETLNLAAHFGDPIVMPARES